VGPTEALIEISHCGLCYTDVHYRHKDQGLGHKGVGVIKEIGSMVPKVSGLKVGDRVGIVSISLRIRADIFVSSLMY
jgi:D-arabinose 1-dehydrogenase-like Zn-dependent alcohol dehydrogenase